MFVLAPGSLVSHLCSRDVLFLKEFSCDVLVCRSFSKHRFNNLLWEVCVPGHIVFDGLIVG
jgi:hypothetical protein